MKQLIYLLVFTAVLYPQQNEKILAKIGNISISENEFRIRYELVPKVNSPADANGLVAKENFLYGLITEKLLSLGARENGFDTVESVRHTINTFEKMFVRDALYKKVVTERSRKYADSLLSFYLESPAAVQTKFIVNKDSLQIHNIWKMLNKGVPFDSIYDDLTKYEKDTSTVFPGQLEDKTEKMLFTLHERSISKPVKIDDGWYIFYISKKNDPIRPQTSSFENDFKQLQKTAKTKAEARFYKEFMSKFFADKKVDASGVLLRSFAEKVCAIFKQKEPIKLNGQNIYLEAEDIIKIESLFGADSLKLPFVKIQDKEIPLKDYVSWYKFQNFNAANSSYRTVAGLMNGKTKMFIEEELLYSEGIKQGLQNDPAVKSDIKMWKDSYLSQLTSSVFYDSVKVTDADVQSYQKNNNAGNALLQVNISEIVTNNLDTVEQVLNELRSGGDIHGLVKKYSIHSYPGDKGETGLVPAASLGENGTIAAGLNKGDVYGPVKVKDGYSIFKLIDKREEKKNSTVPVTDSKELRDQIYYQKVREKLDDYTRALADKYKIQINEETLSNIQLTKLVSIVYRNLGFGGRITAVPFNSSNIDWVKKYKETNNL